MLTKKGRPLIVGIVASLEDLESLRKFPLSHVDWCELRIDLLPSDFSELLPLVRQLKLPKIVTVRDPAEGGANALSEESRGELLQKWLPECEAVDIEFKNLSRFSQLAFDAQSNGKEVIISFHDFARTPPFAELIEVVEQSAIIPNRIFKAATSVESWADLWSLIRLIEACPGSRVAVMGMGSLGKLSRLVLARAGSYLSYGYLGEAVAHGQWSASRLHTLLAEI
jgi:3-dehydroquinate dehydratase I